MFEFFVIWKHSQTACLNMFITVNLHSLHYDNRTIHYMHTFLLLANYFFSYSIKIEKKTQLDYV